MIGVPLFVANWKMNLTQAEVRTYVRAFVAEFKPRVDEKLDTVFAPPYTSIETAARELSGISGIAIGAQNVHYLETGAHTGEISALMLKELGVRFAIIGHSERRQFYGETSEMVAKRAKAALKHFITPIVCIGETTFFENDQDAALGVVRDQLHTSLAGISDEEASALVIAYEPVWAIGTGRAATPEIIHRIHAHIRFELTQLYPSSGAAIPILYGGSTTPENISAILSQPNVSGALVGSTSLKPEAFSRLISDGRRAQGILRDQA